jgi:hypothetical protein
MRSNQLRVQQALGLILILSLAPLQACAVAALARAPASSIAPAAHELAGVWTGTAVSGCTPLRMTGPWRCGARATITLTLIQQETSTITGFYASDRGRANATLEETGRIVELPVSRTRLWLRVIMRDHSSCLFSSNLPRDRMAGSYLCFHEGSSFERGRWAVRRSY